MTSNIWSLQNQILQTQLRDMRKKVGLTQLELANRLNKHQSYVSKYESGERRLDLIELREISKCCGVPLNEFVREFENKIGKEV